MSLTSSRRNLVTIATAAVAAVGGCATTAELAPPVTARFASLAGSAGADVTALERGRVIYVTSCARCHSPEPVLAYGPAQWPGILERMRDRTGLDDREMADLRAYVLTARQLGD